jgi:predicted CoA-substrate-specific enzyme activase
MTLVAGIDVGTRTTRVVLLDQQAARLAQAAQESGARLEAAAEAALAAACAQAGIDRGEISYIASTGYGRYRVPFRQIQITEMTCHAVGALRLCPATRTVLDMGAMNSRALRIAENGRVLAFRMNDRCASGAGRFVERVARALEIRLEEVGALSLRSLDPQPISSICAVLAESEVINHVTAGKPIEDILRGVHNSIADRVVALVRQVGVTGEVTLTGGLTKNAGMVRAIEERLGCRVNVSEDGEFAGALGAALLAKSRSERIQGNGEFRRENSCSAGVSPAVFGGATAEKPGTGALRR